MAQDQSDPLLILLLGAGALFLLTRPSTTNPECTWFEWLFGLGNCASDKKAVVNPFPPGYTYTAETVTQAGPILPSPITGTGTIEGGTSLVTQSGQCQYPDGTVWSGPPGSICPIDVPGHGGQSLPI